LIVSIIENSSPWQRRLVGSLIAIVVAFVLVRQAAGVVLDRWWFDSVTTAPVWRTRFVAQTELAVGTGLLTAAILGTSVWFVLRVGRYGVAPQPRFIERYHERMGPGHKWLLVGGTTYFAYHIGLAASQQWQLWLLFQHGSDIGQSAPVAGGDIGFHLFRLPFLAATSSYLRQLLLFTIVVSALAHLASGALQFARRGHRSSPYAIAHLAALSAALAALQAVHYVVVARPSIATNRVGTFDGPGYTERYLTKPGLLLVALFAVAVGFAAVWLARTMQWRPFLITLGAATFVHLAVLVVLPLATERFVVAPAEAERQLWSIEDNLDATRAAYGLDEVDIEPLVLTSSDDLSSAVNGAEAMRVPLFDLAMMAPALQVLAGTTATRIVDVDIDRYDIDGTVRPVFLAARSASRADLPEAGWVQEHLVYTHGDGVVAVPADVTDDDGRPDVSALAGKFGVDHDPIYFGADLDGWYAIVGTQRTQLGDAEFDGDGIDLGGFGSRLVLSLAVGESQPVLSSELTADSELLYRRSISERVGALAPFLALDGDPYPVITDGRITWVIDGYTTATTYPSAQFVTIAGVPAKSDLAGREVNYLHAAVKATVDAETGETHLYRMDDGDDPVLDVWAGIYPELLEPLDQFPDALRSLVRYPDDLWAVQSSLLGRYHVDSAEQLFNGTGRWAVSAAAATTVGEPTTTPAPPVDQFTVLAGNSDGFASVRPLGPGSASNPTSTRDELAALAVADHDLGGGIHLRVAAVGPDSLPLLSPQVAQSAIDADPEIARAITLLNANGSKVQFGPMTPVLAGDRLVWVRAIIVTGTGSSSAPRLFGVAAVANGAVAVQDTAGEAIAALIGP
jgi:uncharacterized membrane protein (UPF0182 family)